MAIKPKSLTDRFALAYAYDDSFDHGREGYDAAYAQAVETLNFEPLRREGSDEPTLFHFRPLTMHENRKIIAYANGDVGKLTWLAFRLTLERIENGGPDLVFKRARDPEYPDLGGLVPLDVMDILDALPVAIEREPFELVTQLGALAYGRSTTLSGK